MTRIYYFTRTGDSKKIAESIAEQTGGTCFPIADHKSWSGAFGFIKGGFYATSKKKIPVEYEKPQPGDTIYLCFPVWASSFPPAVRAFVDEVGREKIIAVPTSMSSHLGETEGFPRVISVIGSDKTVKV